MTWTMAVIPWQPRTLRMKVRLILLAIATLLVLATLGGLAMFERFRSLALDTSSDVIGTVEATYGYSDRVNRLVALAAGIRDIDSFDRLEAHKREAAGLIDRIEDMGDGLSEAGARSQTLGTLLSEGLRPAMAEAAETQFQKLVLQRALTNRTRTVDDVLDRLMIAADRISTRAGLELTALVADGRADPEEVAQAVRLTRTDNELLAQLQTLALASNTLAGLGPEANISAAQETVSHRLGALVAMLATWPEDAERREIAMLTTELREELWGESGLIPLLERQQVTLQRLETAQARVATLANESANLLGEIIVQQQDDLIKATATAETLSRRIQMNDLVLRLMMMLAILLIMAVYFGRQVTERVLRLAETVRELAAGRTDVEIRPRGTDEIAEMERALVVFRDNARALRRSNAELQEFAYVASHDLRSPLRAIQDLADWTIEDFGDELPPEAQRNLDLIRARSDRLSRLLSDLFAYARADSASEAISDLDLTCLAEELDDLLGKGGSFAVTAAGITRIRTVSTPVRTILMNLVSNAIKHHDRLMGSVVIEGLRDGEDFVITVSDDGPGIERAYQEKIFELFQTLKPRDDIEGSGFGLAYVRKLVHRLDGSITVQSDPEKARGSVFRLKLPRGLMHEESEAPGVEMPPGKVPDAAAA